MKELSFIEILAARISADSGRSGESSFAASAGESVALDPLCELRTTWFQTELAKMRISMGTGSSTEPSTGRAESGQSRARKNHYQHFGQTQTKPKSHQEFSPSRPATDTELSRVKAETAEETAAFELLTRHSGRGLPELFSQPELKSAWRLAALSTHPDRFAQSPLAEQERAAAVFRNLRSGFQLLEQLFRKQ